MKRHNFFRPRKLGWCDFTRIRLADTVNLRINTQAQHKAIINLSLKKKSTSIHKSDEVYLAKLDKTLEIHRPHSEQQDQDVRSKKATKHDQSISEVYARHDRSQPRGIENRKRPNIQTPRRAFLPAQVNLIHYLPSHAKARHPKSKTLGRRQWSKLLHKRYRIRLVIEFNTNRNWNREIYKNLPSVNRSKHPKPIEKVDSGVDLRRRERETNL